MTVSAASASARTMPAPDAAAARAALPLQPQKVGELEVSWRKDESLYLGAQLGPEKGFASVQDAVKGAAGIAQRDGSSVLVVRSGDSYQAHEALQPVWRKGFLRETAFSVDRAQLQPITSRDGDPKFGFFSYKVGSYGDRELHERTGRVKIDEASGVAALVGFDWALVNGRLESVTPERPPAPPAPAPGPAPAPAPGPKPPAGKTLVEDVTEATRLAREAARIIGTVPTDDAGAEGTKAARIKAFKTNMAAQERLERQFQVTGQAKDVVSVLRGADASLEDANWQLAKKPSPDGRFNGVDVPGALRDTQNAVNLLTGLLDDLTKQPATA